MNLAELAIHITAETGDTEKKIKEVANNAGEAAEGFGKLTSGANTSSGALSSAKEIIGGVASKLAALWAAAKVGEAIASSLKSAIDGFADYEQQIGGVETLYQQTTLDLKEYAESVGKTSAEAAKEWAQMTEGGKIVAANASNAYKTAGLSANEYMETATSFAASLVSSLGGNTTEAAKLADVAITDMADNANKMGSDMSSIQNAYNGFAKQNYTMLDNLKLGYGGTKEEMERLIDDANALNAAQGNYTEYSISSYSDIVKAIHDVQVNMGIYETTANEAAGTISGSLAMTKAAWSNLLSGLANPDADVEKLFEKWYDSFKTYKANLTPAVKQMIKSIGTVIKAALKKLPSIVSEGFKSVITGIQEIGPELFAYIGSIFDQIIDWIFGEGTGQMEEAGRAAWGALADAASTAFSAITNVWNTVLKPAFETIVSFIQTTLAPMFQSAFEVISSVVSTVFSTIATFWESILQPAFQAMGDFLSATLQPIFEAVFSSFGSGAEANFGIVGTLWEETLLPAFTAMQEFFSGTLQPIFETVFTTIAEVASTALTGIITFWTEQLQPALQTAGEYLVGTLQPLIEGAFSLISTLWTETLQPAFNEMLAFMQENLQPVIDTVFSAISLAVQTAFDFIVQYWNEFLKPTIDVIVSFIQETLYPIIQTVFDGIVSVVSTVFSTIVTLWTETLYPAFLELYTYINEHIAPIFSDVFTTAQGIVEGVFNAISGFWTNILEPVFSALIQSLEENIGPTFETIWNAVSEVVGTVFGGIVDTWENHLKPCWDAIKGFLDETLGPVFEDVFGAISVNADDLKSAFDTAFTFIQQLLQATATFISEIFGQIKSVFDSLIDFLKNVFTGNWSAAWETIVSAFGTMFDGIKEFAKQPINAVIGFVNGMLSGIEAGLNWVVDKMNGLSFDIPPWVPGIGGNHFGINISPVSFGRIAELEEGGILQRGQTGYLEGHGAEAVIPLEKSEGWLSSLAEKINSNSAKTANVTININGYGKDKDELAEELADRMSEVLAGKYAREKAVFA